MEKRKRNDSHAMIRLSLLLTLTLAGFLEAAIDLRLPTENQHLFSNEPDRFYMYVDRVFEGETSKPWEAGSFGYVRNAVRIQDQVILTKFHEGIDIQPVNRDRAGNPLDLVSSIADGRVVHTSPIAGRSNYGKYVVVEHSWEDSQIYSLYAHLADITCKPGDPLKAGAVLGRMGYTGAGINRIRAHVHLEVAMLMSQRFDDWAAGIINHHGNYNGMNLTGADAARFFLSHKANPKLKFSEFIATTPVYFKVAVPAHRTPDFVTRHPWICRGNPEIAASWEISFSATGMPIAFTPSPRQLDAPAVIAVRPSGIPHSYLTRNLITGQENKATLTESGKKLIALLMNDFPVSEAKTQSTKN
jgi:murein DD-endopeptidase MepM/ murein hydrolase activator NlpD